MTSPHAPSAPKKTSLLALLLAWTLVGLPLGWGLYQSIVKSMPLFSAASATPK